MNLWAYFVVCTSSTGCLVTPMTLSPLLEAAASSSSSEVLRNVETQLKSLEVRPGFHSSLLTIIQHSTDDGTSDVMRLQVVYQNSPPRFVLLWFSGGTSVLTRSFRSVFQAVLYLKNGIDRYWRKTAPNAIPLQEKEDIKTRILQIYIQRLGITTHSPACNSFNY